MCAAFPDDSGEKKGRGESECFGNGTAQFPSKLRDPRMAWLFGSPSMPPSTSPPPAPMAACEETYGIFPCSTSLSGSIILIVVYGQALLIGQSTLRARWPCSQLPQRLCLALDPARLMALTWLHLCCVRARARGPLYVMFGIVCYVCARLRCRGKLDQRRLRALAGSHVPGSHRRIGLFLIPADTSVCLCKADTALPVQARLASLFVGVYFLFFLPSGFLFYSLILCAHTHKHTHIPDHLTFKGASGLKGVIIGPKI